MEGRQDGEGRIDEKYLRQGNSCADELTQPINFSQDREITVTRLILSC